MAAALALTGLFSTTSAGGAPANPQGGEVAVLTQAWDESGAGDEDECCGDDGAASTGSSLAHTVARLPGAHAAWPFSDGRGAFAKGVDGKDHSFLERLFLLLSFPRLAVPGQPGKRVGHAIRWKSPASLAALGLAEDTPAFEIVDVPLLEASVYPQYASGSFHKTCGKWGLYSPAAIGSRRDGAPKRLSRDCIILPDMRIHPAAMPSLRPLLSHTTIDGVWEHVATAIKPLASGGALRTARPPPTASMTPTAAAGLASPPAPTPHAQAKRAGPARSSPMSSSSVATSAADCETVSPQMLSRIVAAVNSVTDVPSLSEGQLRAILALSTPSVGSKSPSAQDSESTRSTAASAASPAAACTPACCSPPPLAASVAATSHTISLPPAAPPLCTHDSPVSVLSATSAATAATTPSAKAPTVPLALVAPASGGRGMKRAAPSQWGDLRVALWDKVKRRRIPAKAYSGGLHAYLEAHPNLEVYNRQDEVQHSQLLAGQRLSTFVCEGATEARVVLWHTREGRKLHSAECPTPASLVAFLRANPHVEVYTGQQFVPPKAPPADGTPPSAAEEKAVGVKLAPADAGAIAPLAAEPVQETANVSGAQLASELAAAGCLTEPAGAQPSKPEPANAKATSSAATPKPQARLSLSNAKPLLPSFV